MFISTPDPPVRHLTDYDFIFTNGAAMPVTLDLALGDHITFAPDQITIHLAPKPGMDPTKLLPAEELTIYTAHLISHQKRERQAQKLTREQQFEWNKAVETLQTV